MISLTQLQTLIADLLFGGNLDAAGIAVFCTILILLFTILKNNIFAAMILAIPAAFVCNLLGLLSTDILMILIVICIIGLVTIGKKAIGD